VERQGAAEQGAVDAARVPEPVRVGPRPRTSRRPTIDRSISDGARTVSEKLLKGVETGGLPDLLRAVRYPNYDAYTVGHSVRVAMLAVQVRRSRCALRRTT
jgi:hypothetical protein